MTVLQRVVVPVATDDDAGETAASLEPYLEEIDLVVALHVVEKAGGGIDKAPMEAREEEAEEMFEVLGAHLEDDVEVRTEITYATDVVDGVFEAARDVEATAVAFTARPGGRLVRLLSGDTSSRLVTDPELPVVALPR